MSQVKDPQIEITEAIRLVLGVARLGEQGLRGRWRSHGLGKGGQYVLATVFPRTAKPAAPIGGCWITVAMPGTPTMTRQALVCSLRGPDQIQLGRAHDAPIRRRLALACRRENFRDGGTSAMMPSLCGARRQQPVWLTT